MSYKVFSAMQPGLASTVSICMGHTKIVVGTKGQLVVPAEVRKRCHLDEGTIMIFIESDNSLILMNQEQLNARVRAEIG